MTHHPLPKFPQPQPRQFTLPVVDVAALERDLRAVVRGDVRFDAGSRSLYATDASNYRQVPFGVVLPRDANDVISATSVCARLGVPITSRGGGTALAGQTTNVAVIFDFSRYMNRLLELNTEQRYAWVEPGIVLDDLRDRAEQHHLTFGPDPATHTHCTLGGMLGNNACGVHSLTSGRTSDNVLELDVLTYDGQRFTVGETSPDELERIIAAGGARGELYRRMRDLRERNADEIRARYPQIPRRVSGYNLDDLLPEKNFQVARALVGSEGTLVLILRAKLQLVPSPPVHSLLVLGYPDAFVAADAVPELLKFSPSGLEGMDQMLLDDMQKKNLDPYAHTLLPEGGGWLMVEFGGETKEDADAQAHRLMEHLKKGDKPPSMKLFDDPKGEALLWNVRESGLGATAHIPGEPNTWPGWEDTAVAPEVLGNYLRDFRALQKKYDYVVAMYGHFGQGCIHMRFPFELTTAGGIEKYRAFIGEGADLVLRYGGSISGEHGDGQAKAALLPKMFGEQLIAAFGEFKAIWDPQGGLNPGKLVHPDRPDENLRLGVAYQPPQLSTHFQFPDDQGSFASATLRCVGVGKCRRESGGTMCPSYMVTREEQHSTRGRAHLLFEMLQSEDIDAGWKSEEVKQALDLCLSCKGCKHDCPVNVDMATYKAEFLSHYYQGRVRPRSAYAFGLIYWWSRLASHAPQLVNFATQTPGLSQLAKLMAGVDQRRPVPKFAPQTFTNWFRQRGKRESTPGKKVILWPDTFNNHLHPEVAKAATEVLEAAGYQVTIPRVALCCGRPLYDYGMLGLAKKMLREIMDALRDDIRAGVPIIGLEPSCVAVFRDELINLFPNDQDARRLSEQTMLLSEFLMREKYQPPILKRKALVHGHCHHKAIMHLEAEEQLLDKMQLEYQVLDSGCCGMAGSFGYEAGERYEVSVKSGERVLLPAVRGADVSTLIISDGFSCQGQIEQLSPRRALHIAQVLQLALQEGQQPSRPYPERGYVAEITPPSPLWALIGAGVLAGGAALYARSKRRPSIPSGGKLPIASLMKK